MSDSAMIAGYTVSDLLGEGAHGVVYRAHPETSPQESVALKIVEHRGNLERILLEPEVLSRFEHPNIVRLRDYSLHAGKLVLVMDYVTGLTLDATLRLRPRTAPETVREFLRQMADALAHAHGLGVYHGDLKPANIIVEPCSDGPRYVVIDFGVSRVASGIQTRRRVAGTYAYMAPEQLRGRSGMSSDLWALGCIAFRMLTGASPFEAASPEELRKKILFASPVFCERTAEWDDELERIITHLLQKSPLERTSSAHELLRELTGSETTSTPMLAADTANVSVRWEEKTQKKVRQNWMKVGFWGLISQLDIMVVPGLVAAAGVWLVARGSERRRRVFIAFGLLILLFGFYLVGRARTAMEAFLGSGLSELLTPLGFYLSLLMIPAGVALVENRRLRREMLMFRLIRSGQTASALDAMANYVEICPGDIQAHEMYIEMLMANGRHKDAVVDALLLLRLDSYNFEASLMLAHSYLELGLTERCREVCNGYLGIAGHCFEFQDLVDRLDRKAGEAYET